MLSPVFGAHQNYGLAKKLGGVCLAGLKLARPGYRIPMIWVRAEAAKVLSFWRADPELTFQFLREHAECSREHRDDGFDEAMEGGLA
jgi:hypothetical protein